MAGRPKGSKNKLSIYAKRRLKELDCDPIEKTVICANMMFKDGEIEKAGRLYCDLISYVAPKLKSVEHDATEEMTQVLRDLTGVKRTKGIHGAS